jgi:LemA protein
MEMNNRISDTLTPFIPLAIILIVLFVGFTGYNGIVKTQERIKEAKAEVENTCQRRLDLIPNLVKIVTAYAKHEKETLLAVTQARQKTEQVLSELTGSDNAFIEKQQLRKLADSQSQLTGSLTALFALVEKYPDLKANANFAILQEQLEGSENRVTIARQRYNEAVRRYNTKTITFPGNLIAAIFGFERNDGYFEATEKAGESLQIQI